MTGTLFVVATPIGNLEDITLRALRVLREVDVVAAEDTRRSGNLLRHFEITTPLLSLHEHNERNRVPQILDRLRMGQSVALVSDAGTPGISDPGAEVVRAVRAAGFAVIPIPGPSALAAAMSVSGDPLTDLIFMGFPPTRSKARKDWLARVEAAAENPVIFFEAPHRIRRTLADLEMISVDRPILIGREVTKVHEEWMEGSAGELLPRLTEPQGEFVLLMRPKPRPARLAVPPSDAAVSDVFGEITNTSVSGRREALRAAAERLGLTVKEVYNAIERSKHSGK